MKFNNLLWAKKSWWSKCFNIFVFLCQQENILIRYIHTSVFFYIKSSVFLYLVYIVYCYFRSMHLCCFGDTGMLTNCCPKLPLMCSEVKCGCPKTCATQHFRHPLSHKDYKLMNWNLVKIIFLYLWFWCSYLVTYSQIPWQVAKLLTELTIVFHIEIIQLN